VNVLVVVAGVLDSEYGQKLCGGEAYRIANLTDPIADLLEELMKGEVLVEISGSRQAVLRGRQDGRLGLDGFAVQFAAEEDYFLPGFGPTMLVGGEEPERVEVLLDVDEVLRVFGERRFGWRNSNRDSRETLGVRTVLQDNEGCRYAQVVDGKRLRTCLILSERLLVAANC